MAIVYTDRDISPNLILGRKVAIVGYGNQGYAHAQNLRDSKVDVRVALHADSKSRERADLDGFCVLSTAEATEWADVIMLCTPDVPMAEIYRNEVHPHLRTGQTILFAHGFNVRFGLIQPPSYVDVGLVSPKGPGAWLRREYLRGRGLAALVAVHQDHTGLALGISLSYAWALGSARVGVLGTTFREETDTDLFGEQAVLCGGIPELVKAGFETLVAAGYQPEVAYFECIHEAKLITDLLYEKGLAGMRQAISDTAEWGGFQAGPRVITDESRQAMKAILEEIQNGAFAARWTEENGAGIPELTKLREAESQHPAEPVGKQLRDLMFGRNSES